MINHVLVKMSIYYVCNAVAEIVNHARCRCRNNDIAPDIKWAIYPRNANETEVGKRRCFLCLMQCSRSRVFP